MHPFTLPAISPFDHLAITLILAIFIGLCVGSFLNVVIHRLPKMLERDWHRQCAELRGESVQDDAPYNLVVPRSACPSCGHRITALENIPIISWLFLRGHCRQCKTPISIRYPFVELMGGMLAGMALWHFGVTWQALAACILLWTLLALAFIDFDTQLLPDNLTLPLLWLGLIANLFGLFVPLADAVIGAVAGYLVLWTVYWAFKLLRGKEGMGYGDFKLLAALGAWLGWQALLPIILFSSLAGVLIGIMLAGIRGYDHNIPMAFGPLLAAAGAITLFWGQPVLAWLHLPGAF